MVCCPAPYEEILDHRSNGIIIRLVNVKIVLSSENSQGDFSQTH